jgi:hypothetical protein
VEDLEWSQHHTFASWLDWVWLTDLPVSEHVVSEKKGVQIDPINVLARLD